jgi:hypothetical protein
MTIAVLIDQTVDAAVRQSAALGAPVAAAR